MKSDERECEIGMAKYCGNCGAQMEDSAKVCGNCGTPFDSEIIKRSNTFVDPEKKEMIKKKTRKKLAVCVKTVVLILLVIVALKMAMSFTGYNGLLRKVMTAYEKYDIEALVSLSSDIYYYGEDDWVEYYFASNVGGDLDAFESSVGHSYKLSYEVDEIYKVSERKLQDMLDEIEYNYYGFDTSVIEKIVIADLTVSAKQGSKSASRDMNIVMSKENGSWRLLYIE